MVAEFYAKDDIFGVARENLFETLYERGYAGALGWQWVDHVQGRDNNEASWPVILENARRLKESRPAELRIDLRSHPGG